MDVSEWLQEIKTSQQPAYIDVQFIKKNIDLSTSGQN